MSVAEQHGCWASGDKEGRNAAWITIRHVNGDKVQLSIPTGVDPAMNATEARYLAAKLNRLAQNIENR